jgi:succinate dehydrogenase / fumarate reductase cytochrome b subunit
MNLPKLHSITKKLLVALLGGFLMIFLLFHAAANLLILLHDDGAAYGAFCHFMGSNILVKIAEVGLLSVFALHIIVTLWLAITNKKARPVAYKQAQKSKTHNSSKLMVWTGILIIVCLGLHFYDFYMVKVGVVKGQYMVKTEKLQNDEMMGVIQFANQMQMSPEELIDYLGGQVDPQDREAQDYLEKMEQSVKVLTILQDAYSKENLSPDGKWIKKLTKEERDILKEAVPDCGVEPDFYNIAREKFKVWHIALMYLVFFAILFFHLRHAFPSAFQTLGLNNYKYNGIIEVLGKIYTWVICLMFAIIPILIYLGIR